MGLDAQAQADEHTQDRTTHAAFHRPATAAGTFTPAPTLMRTLPHEFCTRGWLVKLQVAKNRRPFRRRSTVCIRLAARLRLQSAHLSRDSFSALRTPRYASVVPLLLTATFHFSCSSVLRWAEVQAHAMHDSASSIFPQSQLRCQLLVACMGRLFVNQSESSNRCRKQ